MFSSLVIPLGVGATGMLKDAYNLADSIRPVAETCSDAFMAAGKGLGSVFILICIFYFVTSILDGGKFQMKMLWPVALYLLVSNFGIVSKATLDFSKEVRESLTAGAQSAQSSLNKSSDGVNRTLFQYYVYMSVPKTASSVNTAVEDLENDTPVDPKEGKNAIEGESKGGFIVEAIKKAWFWIKKHIAMGLFDVPGVDRDNWVPIAANSLIFFIIASVIDAIATAMAVVMALFGIIMLYILIAFGPITWSFAIFPGNGKILGTWFIRVCQFSLYGPVALVIRTFCYAACGQLATSSMNYLGTVGPMSYSGDATFSFLMALVILICCIIALMNVPTICSSIIEGASNGVSMMAAAGTLMGGANAVMNYLDLKHDKKQTEMLEQSLGKSGYNPKK